MTGEFRPRHPVTTFSSAVLMVIGATVLAGWVLSIDVLKGLGGQITMKANAAIGLLCCGVALLLVTSTSAHHRRISRAFSAVSGAIGLLTLSQHVIGWNLGIDQLLFTEPPGAAGTSSPARMGINAATSLTLASVALLSLSRSSRRATVLAQVLAACIAAMGLVPTVGYLYGARQLYAIARYTGIAMHTGLAVMVLSLGLLAARPHAGPVAAVTSDAVHGVLARRLLALAVLVPLLLGYARVAGERAGLFDAALGSALLVVTVIVLFSVTIWMTAAALARSNDARLSAELALSETEQRFRALADQAPVLIWVEESGARVWFNRRWFEFTGESAGSVGWQQLVHPDDLAACLERRAAAARGRAGYSHQYRLRRADGEYSWVLETATPRQRSSGAPDYVGSCIDVTELREAQQEREDLLIRERAAREDAERANRAKDEFIAALSHELRTPLNAVVGWMRMVQQGVLSETGRNKAIDVVSRNAGVLARLIEDLIDTSRIVTGHLQLTPGPADLNAVVMAAVESMMPAAQARNINLTLTPDPRAPQVLGDSDRLEQVVRNLLSNAVKFSPAGSDVDVRLSTNAHAATISVRDRGDGITPEFLPHVFERFRQGDSSVTHGQSGLGLGLYIAKHLTELHGGRIEAASDGAGLGADFAVHLPLIGAGKSARADRAVP